MKELLHEAYSSTKKQTGIDPSKPGRIKEILGDDDSFTKYTEALSEGLEDKEKANFRILAESTRKTVLEQSQFQMNPYETLALPILRVYYPKTIARELVTVVPMDRPEIVRGFLRATFEKFGTNNTYSAPSTTDISQGPSAGVPTVSALDIPGSKDILSEVGLTQETAHISKEFEITKLYDDTSQGGNSISVSIRPDVDGNISATVEIDGSQDTLTGTIDYYTGVLKLASVQGVVKCADFSAVVSLEENTINPRVKFNIDKLRLVAKDRQISTEWSIQMEQDMRALYDFDTQAELVSTIGQQIVLDIDSEMVNSLIYAGQTLAGSGHTDTFDKTPPADYSWGPKMWYENVLPKLNMLSAQVYTDTNINPANVLACNPLDASIFESLQEFRYNGTSTEDGDMGYQSATVGNGKWRVTVSPVVPKGKIVALYKPAEQIKATYIYSPYSPCVLTPYPLGNTPSLTVLSRYGSQLVRPNGIAVLNVIES